MVNWSEYFERRGYEPLTKRYMDGWVKDNGKGTRITAIVKGDRLVLCVYRYVGNERSQRDREKHRDVFGMCDKWVMSADNLGYEINRLTCKASAELQAKERLWKKKKVEERKAQKEMARRRNMGRRRLAV